MSVRMRHTRSHTRNRRSHHSIAAPRLTRCSHCDAMHVRHRVCPTCGYYRGRQVVEVLKQTEEKVTTKAASKSKKDTETKAVKKETETKNEAEK